MRKNDNLNIRYYFYNKLYKAFKLVYINSHENYFNRENCTPSLRTSYLYD